MLRLELWVAIWVIISIHLMNAYGDDYYRKDLVYDGRYPKKVNFATNKPNIGYLYNRGSRKFIGIENNNKKKLKALERNNRNVLKFALQIGFTPEIGTYQILSVIKDEDKVDTGYSRSWDDHYGVDRIDVFNGLSEKYVGLYYTTTAANRIVLSQPYYRGETAFKIQISQYCMAVDNSDYMIKTECTDDNNGIPTPENDRQLFELCSVEDFNECIDR